MERLKHPSSEEKDASTSGSGSLTSAKTEDVKEEHIDRFVDDHSPTLGSPPSSSPRQSELQERDFQPGQFVFVLVRLKTDVSMLQVDVVPAWIQKAINEEVIVCTKYGIGEENCFSYGGTVSKSAVMIARSSCVSQEHLDQLKAARTMGRTLKELPMMVEAYEGSLMKDRQNFTSSHQVRLPNCFYDHQLKFFPSWSPEPIEKEESIICTRYGLKQVRRSAVQKRQLVADAVHLKKKSDARPRQNQRQSYKKIGYGSRVSPAQIRQCERARGRSSKKSQRNIGQGRAPVPRRKN